MFDDCESNSCSTLFQSFIFLIVSEVSELYKKLRETGGCEEVPASVGPNPTYWGRGVFKASFKARVKGNVKVL